MKAMVLAAGLGTRLRPLTYEISKPMVPVLDRPVMAHILDLLRRHGIERDRIVGYPSSEFTHAAVAAYIASGMADVGFGLETAARRFGLDFVPVLKERYFFACESAAIERPPLRLVLRLMRSAEFRAVVDALPGYDGRISGTVVPVQHAFSRNRK